MKYAIVNGERIEAKSKVLGFCPICQSQVRGYAGMAKINHWKHISKEDCDSWFEPETEWHRTWKNAFPNDWQETIIKKDGIKHIADIYNPTKELVIEFQNSPMSIDVLQKREAFYDRMIWVVNVAPYLKNITLEKSWHACFSEMILKPAESRYNRIDNSFHRIVDRIIRIYTLKLDGASNWAKLQVEELVSVFEPELKDRLFNSIWNLMTSVLSYEEMRIKVSELVNNLLFNSGDYQDSYRVFNEINQLKSRLIEKYNALNFNDMAIHQDLFFLEWKHQHKHWNFTKTPLFIDTGNQEIYLVKENWEYGSGFIIKRYTKSDFINHYT